MSDEVCFRVRESGPCRDACNLLCLAEDSIFPKDSGARAITKRDSFCMSSVALGSSEEFIGRCEGRISKSRSQGARPPGSGGAREGLGRGSGPARSPGQADPDCTAAGFGATLLHSFPGLPCTGRSTRGPPRARPDCAGGFLGLVKGRGAEQGGACSTQRRACARLRETASPTGACEARGVCRHHSLLIHVTAHRTLKIRLRALGRCGSQRRINTQEGVSPSSPLEIHVPVKYKAAHRGCWGAQAGEDVGGGHLSVARSHLTVTVRHAQALTLEDRGHVAQGVHV